LPNTGSFDSPEGTNRDLINITDQEEVQANLIKIELTHKQSKPKQAYITRKPITAVLKASKSTNYLI